MLPEKSHRVALAWFEWYCRYALRKHFHRLQVFSDPAMPARSGVDILRRAFDPSRSYLYVANHVGFWDGIVLNHLIRTHRRQPLYAMVDAVQVAAHPFFRRVGVFSVDRSNPRDGMRAVRHASDLLNRSSCGVVIFPQGHTVSPDARPIEIESGIARIVERSPGVRVVPIGLRYDFWDDQRPEALVQWGEDFAFQSLTRLQTLNAIREKITQFADRLAEQSTARRTGDWIALVGRRSINRITSTL